MELTRRALGLCAAATGISAAANRGSALAMTTGGPDLAPFDPTPYVNPELRNYVPPLMRMTSVPLNSQTLTLARKAPLGPPALPAPAFIERTAPGLRGAPEVRLYVINARADGPPRPAILYMHGGGFVLGSARASLRSAQELASTLDCVVVSVDYRLAPETKFPGPLEDNYAALKWLHSNGGALRIDPSRIAVMGESAGGGHAAMLAIAARDRGEVPIVYQALIYPMLDDRTGSTRKTPPYQGALIWTAEKNRFGWTALLGVPAGSARVPYGAVPARVEDLRGLPPAFIGVGSIDLFVDEDIDYARRLVDFGIPVTLDVVPGAFHGFDTTPGSALAKTFKASLFSALGDVLEPAR